jgi:putative DNA modification/repair radical SAM protein
MMDIANKLEVLTASAQFDVCGYCGSRQIEKSPLRFIYRAALPKGGFVSLFKVLLTNVCTNDCLYCANQVGRDSPRAAFRPEELARLFMELYRKRLVQGLFLSSGIAGNACQTMESMVRTVEILRHAYQFKGYIHLKVLPGASFDCVEAGCQMASRVSVNIEAPTAQHLAKLSTKKDIYRGILEPMHWVKHIIASREGLVPSGQTTQFVVGAAGETDRDLLHTTEALYRDVGLKRVYFSAFHPVEGTRSEYLHPTPPIRENRLYQVDWLLREYSFSPQEVELALGKSGNLSLKKDPKLVIAEKQPWLFPLDVNKASYEDLLRIPGIGPGSAQKIVEVRRDHSIDSLEQLRKMRVVIKRAAPYIWFKGMLDWEKQMSFLPQIDEGESEDLIPDVAEAVA